MNDCGTRGDESRQKKVTLQGAFLMGVLDVCLVGFFNSNLFLNDEQKSNKLFRQS